MGVVRFIRSAPPAHFKIRLESYCLFSAGPIDKYESESFEAGGYKWKLSIYPNGISNGGEGYISMYLSIADKQALPSGWQVNANFKMFVYNHKEDKYMTIQDNDKVWRFHEIKSEWGHDQLLAMERLYEPSAGYLFEDSCIFGVEVFVVNNTGLGESLSVVQQPNHNIFKWKVKDFSTLGDKEVLSDEFLIGDDNWRLSLYPKGDSSQGGKNISLYLTLADGAKFQPGRKLFVDYSLRVKNQLGSEDCVKEGKSWFSASAPSNGFKNFIPRIQLNNLNTGFLKSDILMVEGEFVLMSVVTHLS